MKPGNRDQIHAVYHLAATVTEIAGADDAITADGDIRTDQPTCGDIQHMCIGDHHIGQGVAQRLVDTVF
jgi:predicted GNAT family acetyltransferase